MAYGHPAPGILDNGCEILFHVDDLPSRWVTLIHLLTKADLKASDLERLKTAESYES